MTNIMEVENRIITLRNQQVILDADVAELYGVETKQINKAVKNNPDKFPDGYIIELVETERNELVKNFHRFDKQKHSTVLPKAFTEKGLYMLATILKSPQAVETTIAIVEAYAKLKELSRVTTMERVQYDPADFAASVQMKRPDTLWRFFECRNDTGVVGYVMEPKEPRYAVLWGRVGKEDSGFNAGLAEVQRTETLLARTLDLLADTAQNIQRALTAPCFYQYVRQYLFFINSEGDTCVHVNFIMQDDRSLFPDRRYLDRCDGDDSYWQADLNLTKARLTDYYVNGPTIYFVNGRSKVPQGLYRNAFFNKDYYHTEKDISFGQLPSALRAVAVQFDTSKIETFRRFSPYYWKYRQNKDGSITNIRKKYKPGSFYRVYTDSLCYGFDAKGRLQYVGHRDEWEGRLTSEALNHFSGMDKMLAAVN